MRKLIITEKANAARRISAILSDGKTKTSQGEPPVITFQTGGDDYSVVSLRGHIIELDYPKEFNDWSGVDPKELVRAPQIKSVKVKSIISVLNRLAEACDEVIIATDYDREGELIGMETVKEMGIPMSKVKRARFSALTKGEVENAFANLTEPNGKLADAAEARQIIDLAWGAVLTRQISLCSGQVGKNFLSVGRVQSPTLKLLVDRNEEIEKFVQEPYWEISAKFGMLAFKGMHKQNPFWNKDEATAVYDAVKDCESGTVVSYTTEIKQEYRPPPFDTTQMQVEANKIGIPPSAAMKLAEDLYTGGFISYPRTENTEYPKSLSLKSVLEKLREGAFRLEAEEILKQEKIVPSKGSRRTTDHPPIYPTASATPDKMKGDKWKLYELIARRFLATVSPAAEAEVTECVIDAAGQEFAAEGYVLKNKGWKKYYGKYLNITETSIPVMREGESVEVRSISMDERKTRPPYRYNQGTLIQEMDRLQLGTKSTRHDIVGKLYSRNYVQGNLLTPTESGIALTKALENHGGGITEPDMTSKLEADMLRITDGERTLESVVKESQDMLYSVATKISEESEAIGSEIRNALHTQKHIGVCPKCGKNLNIRRSKRGNFIGCDGYPECKIVFPMPQNALVQTTDEMCEICGLPMLKIIRKGISPTMQCLDPKCKSNFDRDYLGPCPICKGNIMVRYSKTGKRFAGCDRWPKCCQTYPLRPRGAVSYAGRRCDVCEGPIVRTGNTEECINPDCISRGRVSRARRDTPGT